MLDFVVGHYNYWIVILLMMMGLYIVFSRGNLVKKIVGLNVFQTSVFIFYITVGKVSGGTAPILVGDYGGHGHDDHGEEKHGGAHGAPETAHGDADKAANTLTDEFKAAYEGAAAEVADAAAGGLHAAPDTITAETADKMTNDLASAFKDAYEATSGGAEHSGDLHAIDIIEEGAAHGAHDAAHGADAAHAVVETLYSNPLPHVLILTAIVVGVATTAVGLSLAVRIREAYGTIEEDELQTADDRIEYGVEARERGAAAAEGGAS